jgi:pimeloyl-ACP methyl ester carboxylesterase
VVGYNAQWDLLEHYPRATFAVLDRAGHALPHEQPGLSKALITEWLVRVRERGFGT